MVLYLDSAGFNLGSVLEAGFVFLSRFLITIRSIDGGFEWPSSRELLK